MKVIIDRFEGDFAIVEFEDKTFINMPKQLLPRGAAEGTVLSIEINSDETNKRQKQVSKTMKGLWQD